MKKLLLFLLPVSLFSCIWIHGTTLDGQHQYQGRGYFSTLMLKEIIEGASSQKKVKEILRKRKAKKVLGDALEEDNAVILMLQGKYNDSIKKLLALNQRHPDKYSIASNLGTAYELNGENEKALKWITKGIKRDPNSHYGTEWLHQLILKLKIEESKDKKILQTKRAIPLPLKFNLDDNININNQTHTILDIHKAIDYQLKERLIFVKPKNKIIADLLYVQARIEAQTATAEEGLEYLKLAELYGFANTKLLNDKRSYYQDIIDHPSVLYYLGSLFGLTSENIASFALLIIAIVFLSILLVRLKDFIRNRRKK